MTSYSRWTRSGRAARQAFEAEAAEVDRIVEAWRQACQGSGASRRIDTVSGPTIVFPTITDVTLGPPLRLMVRLLPAQLAGDLAAVGTRLAPSLGGRRLRVEPRGHHHALVTVVDRDPLAEAVAWLPDPQRTHLGRTERGATLTEDWADLPHAVVQGVTRSGKSGWLYAQLAHLAARPHTLVAGSDPSGLLWRPWAGRPRPSWRASGMAQLDAHAEMLAGVVAEMDARIAALPLDRDTVELGPAVPLVVVVMEEYPGLLRAADQADAKLGKRIRALVARLLSESHKAGVRVVLVAQRAEANVIGGFERAMCSFRLSFRVDAADSVKLLHPSAAVALVDDHMTAEPGVALLTAPGRELVRLRGPWLGGYAEYVRLVAGA